MEPRAKSVILGVTGSIAAYKSADLASSLTKLGHSVQVVMTKEAREFITPLTLQVLSKHPVVSDLFDEKEGWQPGHIELADRADLLLIAPATAQIVAELAHGFSNHALAAIALATRAPILIAPAMNGKMWLHPATLQNVASPPSARRPLHRPRRRSARLRLRGRGPPLARPTASSKPRRTC